ncbi:MAG: hypothetical protein ACRENJ_11790 [Candidatus Eiseniibacteriota bacterium]
MQHAQHDRLRRAAARVGLLTVLGIVSLTVTQCRIVGDNVTGVRLFRGQPTTCIKDCNDQYKLLFDQEQKLHQTNVENCQALPQPDRAACLAAEDARHQARKAELSQAKIDCQNNCHHQGAGTAG